MQKIEARRHQKEGRVREGKGEKTCQEQHKRQRRKMQQGIGDRTEKSNK